MSLARSPKRGYGLFFLALLANFPFWLVIAFKHPINGLVEDQRRVSVDLGQIVTRVRALHPGDFQCLSDKGSDEIALCQYSRH